MSRLTCQGPGSVNEHGHFTIWPHACRDNWSWGLKHLGARYQTWEAQWGEVLGSGAGMGLPQHAEHGVALDKRSYDPWRESR